jgi:hypothetical protein
MTDDTTPTSPDRRAGRGDPPAQTAKVISAGISASAVFGLVAILGWTDRPAPLPAPTAPTAPGVTPAVTSPAAPTSGLVPLATTLPPSAVAPTSLAPATEPPATIAPVLPAPAPSQAVSEQRDDRRSRTSAGRAHPVPSDGVRGGGHRRH